MQVAERVLGTESFDAAIGSTLLPRTHHETRERACAMAVGAGGEHLGQYRGLLGQTMRLIIQRKNRSVAVVACARKLAVLLWHVLTSGEPFRYALPKSLEAKYSRLRVRATGRRHKRGAAKGAPWSPQYVHGRTRAIPSLPQVLAQNDLPEITPLARGERIMLQRKKLEGFYCELQTPSRTKANPRQTQVL